MFPAYSPRMHVSGANFAIFSFESAIGEKQRKNKKSWRKLASCAREKKVKGSARKLFQLPIFLGREERGKKMHLPLEDIDGARVAGQEVRFECETEGDMMESWPRIVTAAEWKRH